jgi:hypothetical protein
MIFKKYSAFCLIVLALFVSGCGDSKCHRTNPLVRWAAFADACALG